MALLRHRPGRVEQVLSAAAALLVTAMTAAATAAGGQLLDARETHLANVRQLTSGGENAEAYWSPDGSTLILQSTRPPYGCDQIFTVPAAGGELRLVSTGTGRTTCAYYLSPERVIYSSTHEHGSDCPPPPDRSKGYVWPLLPYDIFSARPDGSALVALTRTPGYDAEATASPDGKRIVFTSVRDGDIELYSMAADGNDVRRLTYSAGYDGGAFFSPDGSKIVYRAHHPRDLASVRRYRELLALDLVEPRTLEILVMRADGTGIRQVTANGAANFAPYWHPDGRRILFASNVADPRGRDFDLYLVGEDGSGLERVTYDPTFDGFPMFSPDGRRLAWASNRNASVPGETNIFVADWLP